MNQQDRLMVEAVVNVLKKRFNNLNATELVQISYDILIALDEIVKKHGLDK